MPTVVPTVAPTAEPTAAPTAEPTAEPTAAPTPEPTPAAFELRVNVAGNLYIDTLQHTWAADQPFNGEWGYTNGRTRIQSNNVANTDDDAMYLTYREDPEEYRFAVPNGTYLVVLSFAEFEVSKDGDRLMEIDLEGTRVADKFSIYKLAGKNSALDQSFQVAVDDGELVISFFKDGSKKKPVVSGIQVLQLSGQ